MTTLRSSNISLAQCEFNVGDREFHVQGGTFDVSHCLRVPASSDKDKIHRAQLVRTIKLFREEVTLYYEAGVASSVLTPIIGYIKKPRGRVLKTLKNIF